MKQLLLAFAITLALGSSASATWPYRPHSAPQQVAAPHPATTAPYAGRPNYAHSVQPFHWGWFGAESFAPSTQRHRGYYGTTYKWANQRW